MALTFNPREAVQKLRDHGMAEPLADATVEVIEDATGALVTPEYLDARIADVRMEIAGLRADFSRALLILAGFIVAVAGASLAASQVLG